MNFVSQQVVLGSYSVEFCTVAAAAAAGLLLSPLQSTTILPSH
jgi:hypothetical protein